MRYRYDVSQTDGDAASSQPAWRISAPDIETPVRAKLRASIEQPVAARIAAGDLGGDTVGVLTAASNDALASLAGSGAAVRPLLLRLVGGIALNEQRINAAIDLSEVHPAFEGESTTASAAIGFVRTGQRIRLIVPPSDDVTERAANPSLVKLVTQAYVARRALDQSGSAEAAAMRLGFGREYISDLLRMSYLAPSIVKAIFDGTNRPLCPGGS